MTDAAPEDHAERVRNRENALRKADLRRRHIDRFRNERNDRRESVPVARKKNLRGKSKDQADDFPPVQGRQLWRREQLIVHGLFVGQ
ncbi:hypothetical protein [Paraburkholderia sp.]|uniref:hypothetical protein n=1 Tax=Paraburkholderia sp. TaxID=1926495 RepID=UPI00238C358B|nr:hypothetical protein [Paraburkholderia sp.]MDE1180512.1 hypothetical protein [Paraburkholderia sp.]